MIRTLIPCFVLTLGLLLPVQTQADDFIFLLKNGDRLTGALQSETPEHYVVDTAWQKGLLIPMGSVESKEPVPAKPVDPAPAPVAPPEAAPVVEATGPPVEPKTSFWDNWKGELQLGLDMVRSEKDRDLWHGRGKLNYASGPLRQGFDLSATYGKTDGVVSANRMEGNSKTDWDLTKRTFLYNLGSAGYDDLRKIEFQYEVGPGVGYRLITGTNFVLNLEFGGNYSDTTYSINQPKRRELGLRFAEDATWRINSKFLLEEKISFTPSADDFSNYRLRLEGALKYLLLENLSLNLSVVNIFDSRPAGGIGRNDLQIRSTVGVSF